MKTATTRRVKRCFCRSDGVLYESRVSASLHFYPNWSTLKLHLIIEKMLEEIPAIWVNNPLFYVPYHVISGINCAYTMKEIILYMIDSPSAPHHDYFIE